MLSNIKTAQKDRGFTIVELLIVVVVIGILAAITIVAYNGISNRAKTTKAQATASSIAKKMEAYNAEIGSYPANYGQLTGAASTTTYNVSTSDATYTTAAATLTAGATDEKTLGIGVCTTGLRIAYWKYDAPTSAQFYYIGGATASSCSSATAFPLT